MGEYETLNFCIGMLPEDIAMFHALYRTSIKGRKDIIYAMFADEFDENAVKLIDNSYTSRVAEIFNVVLKTLGMKVDFLDEENDIPILPSDNLVANHIGGQTYICSEYEGYLLQQIYDIRERILSERPVITVDELNEAIKDELQNKMLYDGYLKEDLLSMLNDSKKAIKKSDKALVDALSEKDDEPDKTVAKKKTKTSKDKPAKEKTATKKVAKKKAATK